MKRLHLHSIFMSKHSFTAEKNGACIFLYFFSQFKKTNLDARVNGGCSTQKVFQFLEGRIGTLHFVQVVFDHLHVASLRRDQTRLQQR